MTPGGAYRVGVARPRNPAILPLVRYLNFRFAFVGEVALEAPSAEMAPRERGVARLISST